MARGVGGRGPSTRVLVCLLVAARTAAAEPPPNNPAQAAATVSYGISQSGSHDPWALGVGVFAGYTLPEQLFLGLEVDYFFGEEESGPAHETAWFPVKVNYFEPMLQVGYDWNFAYRWFLRPGIGGGVALLRHRACVYRSDETGAGFQRVSCQHQSAVDAVLAPSVAVVFRSFVMLMWRIRYDVVFTDYDLSGMQGISFPMHGVVGTFGVGI